MPAKLLIPREKYLTAGVHIGMTARTADMRRFIYKVRSNGLAVLNVGMLDKRIALAANFLADKKSILVVCRKENGHEPAAKFAEAIGARAIVDRFMPGSLTNPTYKNFFEPDVLVVVDPDVDKQAMKEAVKMHIPIVGLADTFNETSFLDVVLPANNKGKKSLALIFWLLAKLITEKRNGLDVKEFTLTPEDFGYA